MEIYVHTRGGGDEIALIELESTWTVAEVLSRTAAPGDADAWLEEGEKPLERAATLATVGVEDRAHLHVSTCWAAGPQGFGLTPSERAKHTLAVCDGNIELDRSAHIGSFTGEDCSTCLDLAPKERFEG